MARRSLKPQLNQIRTWVRQGRTDAWIAHQLEVPVRDIDAFKREHDLAPEDDGAGAGTAREEPELDLRAEDDALVAAALDAEPPEDEESDEDDEDKPRRRRGRRGGRGRKRGATGTNELEGSFDHGEDGYGLWLDPAVQDSPVYAEHWAGHRPVIVSVEPEQIVIRRVEEDGGDEAPAEPVAELDPDEFDA